MCCAHTYIPASQHATREIISEYRNKIQRNSSRKASPISRDLSAARQAARSGDVASSIAAHQAVTLELASPVMPKPLMTLRMPAAPKKGKGGGKKGKKKK